MDAIGKQRAGGYDDGRMSCEHLLHDGEIVGLEEEIIVEKGDNIRSVEVAENGIALAGEPGGRLDEGGLREEIWRVADVCGIHVGDYDGVRLAKLMVEFCEGFQQNGGAATSGDANGEMNGRRENRGGGHGRTAQSPRRRSERLTLMPSAMTSSMGSEMDLRPRSTSLM